MGLTIHYRIRADRRWKTSDMIRVARLAHRRAADFVRRRGLTQITPFAPVDPTSPWSLAYAKAGGGHAARFHDVAPLRGWMFHVSPGHDCEPVMFALCRYPASILVRGQRVRTRCGGWNFASHCKTQYASLHGEAHFLHCHRAVIDLLRVWERLGLHVEIYDEGGYWPGRDERTLLAEVRQMNGIVAALAGAVKDAAEETGMPVESPIFRHPAFEHLEAEGATQHAAQLTEAVRTVTARPPADER